MSPTSYQAAPPRGRTGGTIRAGPRLSTAGGAAVTLERDRPDALFPGAVPRARDAVLREDFDHRAAYRDALFVVGCAELGEADHQARALHGALEILEVV